MPGRAAEAGVTAALAAREGVTGSLDVIEGEAGLRPRHGRRPRLGASASPRLGTTSTSRRMTFKNHACCGHTFAAIDGALALQERMRVAARDIERVRVGTLPRGARRSRGYESPATPAEARFSLKYVVATALTHGSVRLAAFEPARLHDPATRELMARIEVAVDPELDAAFPAQRAARVAIAARDGRRGEHPAAHAQGRSGCAALRRRNSTQKYLELAGPGARRGNARASCSRDCGAGA